MGLWLGRISFFNPNRSPAGKGDKFPERYAPDCQVALGATPDMAAIHRIFSTFAQEYVNISKLSFLLILRHTLPFREKNDLFLNLLGRETDTVVYAENQKKERMPYEN